MALPLMVLTTCFTALRRPAPTDSRFGYQSTGRHQTLAATLSLLIAGGVGLTLATALVMPDILKKPVSDPDVINIPADPPKPEPVESTDPLPQSESHITTVPTPLPIPVAGPTVRETPMLDLGPSILVGPMVDPVPFTEPTLPEPHVPLFRPAQRNPRFADRFQPPYPASRQREGVEGRCPVSVSISANGRVSAVRNNGCADDAFFRATERQALNHWRFTPATRDGEPVDSTQDLMVVFRITSSR